MYDYLQLESFQSAFPIDWLCWLHIWFSCRPDLKRQVGHLLNHKLSNHFLALKRLQSFLFSTSFNILLFTSFLHCRKSAEELSIRPSRTFSKFIFLLSNFSFLTPVSFRSKYELLAAQFFCILRTWIEFK